MREYIGLGGYLFKTDIPQGLSIINDKMTGNILRLIKKREARVEWTRLASVGAHTMNAPTTNLIKSYKIGQDNVDKIRSFLNIQLKEIWLIKRREKLSESGQENLRMIGVEAGRIEELLPGGQNDK